MKLDEKELKRATKRYNDIMETIGYEHNTIGTKFSEDTEGWNIRDMVAECDYTLDTYYEEGHANGDMRYSEDPEERKMWRSETGRLSRFIEKYKPYIRGVKCVEGHCSCYDN